MLFQTLFLLFVTIFGIQSCENEIKSLPGLNHTINFKHFAGFLETTNEKALFYWFVESQNDPKTDPLIFWLNGGPGCSSVGGGLLSEMGPYLVNNDGKTLRDNPNSWNKFASIVYIESPYGVGYFYNSKNTNVKTNDTQTAKENYTALKQFFKKHPKYRNHSTFIIGESYGGIYVPTLTSNIIDGQSSFPLKLEGIGIGNGALDMERIFIDEIEFGYSHGLIEESLYDSFRKDCCQTCNDTCLLTEKNHQFCAHSINQILDYLQTLNVNPYDIYRECESTGSKMVGMDFIFPHFIELKKDDEKKNHKQNVQCFDLSGIEKYLNNPVVRKSLHVPHHVDTPWEVCSKHVRELYKMDQRKVYDLIEKAINANIRVLLYYGDTDMVCPFPIGQNLPIQLGLSIKQTKTPWKFKGKIAGMKTIYEKLTFTTLMGVGHMAPQWKSAENAYLIKKFLNDQNF